jgi:serine/threonine protein kinase/tetratricopeptide (TPR) repeat protein
MVSSSQVIGNRYILLNQLGAGAMGAVYRAKDRLTGEIVALKRVLSSGSSLQTRLALTKEFQTLASLRHPNIISVLDYGIDEQQYPYIVMSLVQNALPLHEAAEDLRNEQKVELLIQMLQALAYLHRRGIIHRDLKPANVLVTENTVKVLDFGLAVEAEQAKEIGGTLLYMSPEVLQLQPAGIPSDLFAVGVMAYQILTGLHPFDSDEVSSLLNNILFREPDLTLLSFDGVSKKSEYTLTYIIRKLLEKKPINRYPDAESAIEALAASINKPDIEENASIRDSFLQAAKFIGRDNELSTLMESLENTMIGVGSNWLISGESGIGKSRLLDELRIQAMVRGATVLRGQDVVESRPFQLWREPIRRMALMATISDLDATILREVVPEIEDILGRSLPTLTHIDSRDELRRLVVTIANLFRNVQTPVLLILEDIQWSKESLEPLKLITQIESPIPLMVVCSYRTDAGQPTDDFLKDMRQMKLDRLNEQEVRDLSISMLGRDAAKGELVKLLNRETEGNIYFLVETVRTLAEIAGSLKDIGEMTLPAHVFAGGVQQVVRQRLQRVPIEQHPFLFLGAVIGREVDMNVLTNVGNINHTEVEDWLTTCVNVGVLEIWDGKWRFCHDKLREAVLLDIPESDRPHYHRLIALAIEATYPNEPSQYHVLADHWHQAKDSTKEKHYASLGGQLALGMARYAEGLELYQRVLEYSTEQESVSLLKSIGDCYEGLAQYIEAIASYEHSKTIAQKYQDIVGIASAWDGIARIEDKRGNFPEAEDSFTQAMILSRQVNARQLESDTLNGLGTISAKRGNLAKAAGFFSDSLVLRREMNDKKGIAASLNNLGIVENYTGNFAKAKEYYEEALQLRRDIGDVRGIAGSLNNLGIIAKKLSNLKEARKYYEEAREMTRNMGDLHSTASILNNLGIVLYDDDELKEATRIYNEAYSIGQKIGDELVRANALQAMGDIAKREVRFEEAIEKYTESISLHRQLGSKRDLAETLMKLGSAYIEIPNLSQAEFLLLEGLELYRKIGDKDGIAKTLRYIGRVMLKRGNIIDARYFSVEALELFNENKNKSEIFDVMLIMAELANTQQDYWTATQILGFLANKNLSEPQKSEAVEIGAVARARLTDGEVNRARQEGSKLTIEEWTKAFSAR